MERVVAYKTKRLDGYILKRLRTSDLTKRLGIRTKQDVQVVSSCIKLSFLGREQVDSSRWSLLQIIMLFSAVYPKAMVAQWGPVGPGGAPVGPGGLTTHLWLNKRFVCHEERDSEANATQRLGVQMHPEASGCIQFQRSKARSKMRQEKTTS